MHGERLLVLVAILLGAARAQAKPVVPCAFYGMNPGAPTWNGKVLLDDKLAAALAASGAGAVRIDFRLEGPAWDGTPLSLYDQIIDRVRANGLEPLGLLAYEGVPGSQVDWNSDPNGDGFNPYVDSFANTAKLLFSHFKGRIKRWEIWNEPNCWSNPNYANDPQNAGCTYLTPRVFSKMLAECYVRSEALVDGGDVAIVSGGLFAHDIGGSTSNAADYLAQLYGQGVWDWLNANSKRHYAWGEIGYHLYVHQGTTADAGQLTSYLDAVRQTATGHGDSSPFSITEVGWNTVAVSPAVQAQNLGVAYDDFAARFDVTDVHWFSYADSPAANLYFGLTDGNGNAKPSLAAEQAEAAGCLSTSASSGAGGAGACSATSQAAGTASASASASASGAGGQLGAPPSGGSVSGAGAASGAPAAGAGGAGGTSVAPAASGCGCRICREPNAMGALAAALIVLAATRRRARPNGSAPACASPRRSRRRVRPPR